MFICLQSPLDDYTNFLYFVKWITADVNCTLNYLSSVISFTFTFLLLTLTFGEKI